jgi:mannose-6-phosphate isomerase-like protein (cupin superfamily)
VIRYGDGWMTCCRAMHPEEVAEQITALRKAAADLGEDFSRYTVSYQVTMNIGDSAEQAETAFGEYISSYYPELSKSVDLSNWGPTGTPETVAGDGDNLTVITLGDVPPVQLPGGSWSRVLVARETVGGNASALGYSVFKPGTSTADLSHSVEELAYIVSGSGVIRLETGDVPVAAGQALYVPARLWHTVVNPGEEDLVMVFSFPSPGYPPTERR